MENAKDLEVKDIIYKASTEKEINAGKSRDIDISGITHDNQSNIAVSAIPEEKNIKKENFDKEINDDNMPTKGETTSSNDLTFSCDKCPY